MVVGELVKRRTALGEERTIKEVVAKHSSQSLGTAGSFQKIFQGDTQTIRYSLQRRYKKAIAPNHVIWPWEDRHTACIRGR